jgi:probable HAF family extracellular repeat protein
LSWHRWRAAPDLCGRKSILVAHTVGGHVGAVIDSGGRFQDLNNLVPRGSAFALTNATGINDSGQIVAHGSGNSTGQNRAFLLTPR